MSLVLTIRYTCQLPEVERVASISTWRNWSMPRSIDEAPVEFNAEDNVVSKPFRVAIPLSKDGSGKVVLPADASVMFEVLASVFNDDHNPVRVRGGYSLILLDDLLNKDTRNFQVEYFNDWDPKGARTKCGELEGLKIEFAGIERADVAFAKPTIYSFVEANSNFLAQVIMLAVARKIVPYTEEAASKGKGMTPIRPILSRVQAPWYNSTAGLTYGPFYWMLPTRSSNNESYFDELLANALLRHNRDRDWYKNTISNQFERIKKDTNYFNDDFNECVRITGDALCMPSTALPYISDTVDSNKRKLMPANKHSGLPSHDPKLVKPSESWDCAIVRNGGDCEDLARLIHVVFQGMRHGSWSDDSLPAAAARLLKLYVGCGTLGSVLSPALGNNEAPMKKASDEPEIIDSKEDRDANVGAHMFYEMHPRAKIVAMMRRTTADLPDDLEGEFTQPGWKNLISCILEGTGRLDPFQLPAAAASTVQDPRVRQALVDREIKRRISIRHLVEGASITSMMQMTRAQRQIKRVPNARMGEFYRQTTTFVTLELLKELNALEFSWCTLGERIPEPADADPLFVSKTRAPTLASAAALGSDKEEKQSVDNLAAEDEWSSVSLLLENMSSPSLGISSAIPAAAAPAVESKRPSALHRERVDIALNAPFARGVKSIHGALAAEARESSSDVSATFGKKKIRYGIDVEDKFRPLDEAPHVGVLPTTSLDPVEARVGAEMLRNLRPITLPGDFAAIEKIFAAEDASLKALGIDTRRGEKEADEAVVKLKEWANKSMGGDKWPTHQQAEKEGLSLVTLFFQKTELRPKKNGGTLVFNSIVEQYGPMKKNGFIRHARINVEAPLPRREHVVLQFMCDSSKATVAK